MKFADTDVGDIPRFELYESIGSRVVPSAAVIRVVTQHLITAAEETSSRATD